MFARSVFLLFGASGVLKAAHHVEEEPPMACLESGACYQVVQFVRFPIEIFVQCFWEFSAEVMKSMIMSR